MGSRLYSSDDIIKALERKGFVFISQKGSHAKYRKYGKPTLTAIVPVKRKQIPMGTLHSILRQSNLKIEDIN